MICVVSCLAVAGSGGNIRGMADTIREFKELHVSVDDVIYMPSLEASPEKPHPFVYFISLYNESALAVTIRGRKWVVQEAGGEVTVMEGSGVVGQTPLLNPGEHFSYNSYHMVARSALVTGAFFAETANGERVFARIPEFRLQVPAGV
jgi:ApaG protein